MWWQVLPPLGIIGVVIGLQVAALGTSHYIFTGRPTDRRLTESYFYSDAQKIGYLRDRFNNGNEWTSKGLENIPDEA